MVGISYGSKYAPTILFGPADSASRLIKINNSSGMMMLIGNKNWGMLEIPQRAFTPLLYKLHESSGCLRFAPMMFWRLSIFKFRATFRFFPASVCCRCCMSWTLPNYGPVMSTATCSTVARQNELITAHLAKKIWDPEVGDPPESVGQAFWAFVGVSENAQSCDRSGIGLVVFERTFLQVQRWRRSITSNFLRVPARCLWVLCGIVGLVIVLKQNFGTLNLQDAYSSE